MRSAALLLLLAPFCLAWTAGGSDRVVREWGDPDGVRGSATVSAEGLAVPQGAGIEVVLTLPVERGGGSGVLGLSLPGRSLSSVPRNSAARFVRARYREYDATGRVLFDNEWDLDGSIASHIHPQRGLQLDFELIVTDPAIDEVRVLIADAFVLRFLGDDPPATYVEPGGDVVIAVGDDGYYDEEYYDDGYESGGCDGGDDWEDDDGYDSGGGCDGDDWDDDDGWGSDDSGGCDGGDDWDSGDSGGCDGDDLGSSEAPSCDCEGDALAARPGARGPRSPWVMRAFNWAPWFLVVLFIHGMKRRRRRFFSARPRS